MRKTQLNKTQKTAVVGGTVLALAVGGVAFAAWTSSGSGTGSATAGTSANSVITSAAITGVYPTGSFPTSLNVTNPNSYKITVSNLRLASVSAPAGCNAGDAGVTTADVTQLSGALAANSTTNATPAVVKFSNDLSEGCKDATITLNWAAAAASSN